MNRLGFRNPRQHRPRQSASDDAPAQHDQPVVSDLIETDHDALEHWLSLIARLLDLPDEESEAVTAELRSHLTERIRDLELQGHSEMNARSIAIGELGDAAELARRFRQAHTYRKRRLVMNTLFAGIGIAVIATSAALFSSGGQSSGVKTAVFQQDEQRADAIDRLETTRISIDIDMTPRQIISHFADARDIGISMDWSSLAEADIAPDEPLGYMAEAASILDVIREFNRRAGSDWHLIDWRLHDRMLIIDEREVFERRERVLVRYDIAGTLQLMGEQYGIAQSEAVEQISNLIQEMVEPESWENYGGTLAKSVVIGGKMFINAPPRIHEKVKWILDELADGESQAKPEHPAPAEDSVSRNAGGDQPLVTIVPLNHVDVQQVADLLGSIASDPVQITPDPRTNTLIFSAPESRVEPWSNLLVRLDYKWH